MPVRQAVAPNLLLRQARRDQNWSQQAVADQIGTTIATISRWERGVTVPGPYYRQRLCALFGVPPTNLGFLPPTGDPAALPSKPVWHLPMRRNPLFTGRHAMLAHLRDTFVALAAGDAGQVLALSGMTGIGKTQTAIAYAYQYRDAYQTVLWARADADEHLAEDFAVFARLLGLRALSPAQAMTAVVAWLEPRYDWLLIFDNANDLTIIAPYVPHEVKGHILVTTQSQAVGPLARRVDVPPLTPTESLWLLLRRAYPQRFMDGSTRHEVSRAPFQMSQVLTQAGFVADEMNAASTLCAHLGHLPLALDQAGAYIERTGCAIADYLAEHAALLDLRGPVTLGHPDSIRRTVLLTLDRLQQQQPAAAAILLFCCFLDTEAIPIDLLRAAALIQRNTLLADLTELPRLHEALALLRQFSLIYQDADAHILRLHCLVPTIIHAVLSADEQRIWATLAVQCVQRVWSASNWFSERWLHEEQYLAHALRCLQWIQRWKLAIPATLFVVERLAQYYAERGMSRRAHELETQAGRLRGEISLQTEKNHHHITLSAQIRQEYYQGKYHDASAHLQYLALEMGQHLIAEEYSEAGLQVGMSFFFQQQGDYPQAGDHFQQALALWQAHYAAAATDARVIGGLAFTLADGGWIAFCQGAHYQAEKWLRQSLDLWRHTPDPKHVLMGHTLNGLARLALTLQRYDEAEGLLRQECQMLVQTLGPHFPMVANNLIDWAQWYTALGAYADAQWTLSMAQEILTESVGHDHPLQARALRVAASLAFVTGQPEQVTSLLRRAYTMNCQTLDPRHYEVEQCRADLDRFYDLDTHHENAVVAL